VRHEIHIKIDFYAAHLRAEDTRAWRAPAN